MILGWGKQIPYRLVQRRGRKILTLYVTGLSLKVVTIKVFHAILEIAEQPN